MSNNAELIARRNAAVSPGVGRLNGVAVSHGRGAVLTDLDGKDYIDLASGIGVMSVGHSHPAVLAAVASQCSKLQHACIHVSTYEPYVALCEKLIRLFPHGESTKAMLVNSGAEAVENAVKIARQATGRPSIICFTEGFHGRTLLATTLTSKVGYKLGCGPYAPETYRQIYPWHHAAGDFVVKGAGPEIEVKLTTARNYLPLISFPKKADSNRVTALVAFLLNMVVQMRLDRIGGVGEPIWAQEEFVRPCLEGFFRALATKNAEGRGEWKEASDLPALLKRFSKEELHALHAPLMESYREEKPEDYKLIENNLEGHIATLWQALRAFDEAVL